MLLLYSFKHCIWSNDTLLADSLHGICELATPMFVPVYIQLKTVLKIVIGGVRTYLNIKVFYVTYDRKSMT